MKKSWNFVKLFSNGRIYRYTYLKIVKVSKKLNTKNVKDLNRNTEGGLKFFNSFNSNMPCDLLFKVEFTHERYSPRK